MVSLVMLAIMAGCAVFLYLKGTLVQGVTMVFNAILAGFVAFGFFEMLSRYLIKYAPDTAAWAPMICFLLLFILVFAVLQTAAMQLGKEKADLGLWPERIGRVVCGLILGYVATGHLLVALAMVPHTALNKYPYQRFEERNPDPSRPNKPLLSPDGFAAGLFGTVSKGSFRAIGNPRSFALLHASYLDQLYLNRLKISQGVPIRTSSPSIDVPRKNGVWHAPDNLRDAEGKPLSVSAGEGLMLVRIGIRKRALKDAGKFTLSQLRLLCGPKGSTEHPLAGRGRAVYPIGYIGANGRLEKKSLGEVITIQSADVPGDAVNIDLAFSVPTNLIPLLLEFKHNNVVQVSAPALAEDAPEVIPFGAASEPPRARRRTEAPAEGRAAPPSDNQRNRRGLGDISRSVIGDQLDEN